MDGQHQPQADYPTTALPVLPRDVYLSINRCNLPASILGGLTFQHQPAPLVIDGVASLHRDLFTRLEKIQQPALRAQQFSDYMDVHFCLNHPEQAGYEIGKGGRPKANWKRMLRGWSFDSDSREGAVLKAWVESRFGLLPRFHKGPIRDFNAEPYWRYLEARAQGLYNTHAIEAQLDLVYSYCQYELNRRQQGRLCLYRGVNRIEQLEQLDQGGSEIPVMLLNNLNSFSKDPERASEFGDRVVSIFVPSEKIFCCHSLFPKLLQGEGEYIVIGGLYQVSDWIY